MKVILHARIVVNVPKDRRDGARAAMKGALDAAVAHLGAAGLGIEGSAHDIREAFKEEILLLTPRRVHLFTGKGIPTRRATEDTACGKWAGSGKSTVDRSQVTCQLCLRRIRQWERVERPEENRISGAGEDCLDCYHPFADHNLDGSCRTCKAIEADDPKGDRLDPPHQHRCLSARPGEEPEPPRKRGRVHVVPRPDQG